MNSARLANMCGVTSNSLKDLVNGFVNDSISERLSVRKISLQIFVDGGTSIDLSSKFGIATSDLQELRNEIEREGAIGIIIGLLLKDASCLWEDPTTARQAI